MGTRNFKFDDINNYDYTDILDFSWRHNDKDEIIEYYAKLIRNIADGCNLNHVKVQKHFQKTYLADIKIFACIYKSHQIHDIIMNDIVMIKIMTWEREAKKIIDDDI
jgi:hypothetical protein